MLGEYKVSRCTRRCHALDRPLREGEWYFSVVLERGEEFERRDYSSESWQGPPEGTIGWWKNRMPTADEKKLVLAPPKVLVELLRKMADMPERAATRYLLALMLMRKKLVRPVTGANAESSGSPAPKETLHLEVVADGSRIEVAVCEIGGDQADRLREELNELLYCEAEPEPDGLDELNADEKEP